MDRQDELSIIRAAYAKQILAAGGVDNARLQAAFGAIRREDFLGPGPWPILRWPRDYLLSPDTDPVYLYTNDLVGIVPERRINNGQPAWHAHLIHQASPAACEHVVHVGTGTGYYTAILAHLAGRSGRVTGIEYDSELAAQPKANLAPHPNVEIVEGDGALVSFDEADVIYVNAGCTRPAQNRAAPPPRGRAPDPADDVGPGFWCERAGTNGERWRCLSHRASRSRLF